MPVVSPSPTLRDALDAYIAQSGVTKAEAAATLGVDPMTLARFLKSGRVIDANRRKLALGLARVGAYHSDTIDEVEEDRHAAHVMISSDKVIAALEFLLSAARDARAAGSSR